MRLRHTPHLGGLTAKGRTHHQRATGTPKGRRRRAALQAGVVERPCLSQGMGQAAGHTRCPTRRNRPHGRTRGTGSRARCTSLKLSEEAATQEIEARSDASVLRSLPEERFSNKATTSKDARIRPLASCGWRAHVGGGVAVSRIRDSRWWRVLVFYHPLVPSDNFLSSSEVAGACTMGCCITKEQGEPAPVGRLADNGGTKAKAEAEAARQRRKRGGGGGCG